MSEPTQTPAPAKPTPAVGTRVWYVPDVCHRFTGSASGEPQFHFHYSKDSPGRHRAGDPVNLQTCGKIVRTPTGLRAGNGHDIHPGAPRHAWPAWVVGVNADGSVDLDVAHAWSWRTPGECPDREKCFRIDHVPDRAAHPQAAGVRYDPANKAPHTFHLQGD